MKKIISLVLTLGLLISYAPMAQVHAAISEDEGITSLLKELEIMQGDENGDMMLDKKVSRAEFAKIAIAASPEKNSVAIGLKQSPFKDVPYTTWYAPYVKAAVSAGYVMGYLDATFRPENTVTYEEAATILIRVLGYDDTTFSTAYPYGQLSKAQGLDMLDDVNAQIGDELTRYQVMRMVYNSLKASIASTPSAPLISSHDCTMTENADVIATANEDDSLGADKVFTSAGTYTKGDYFSDKSAGMTGTIFIKNNKKLVSFVPDTDSNDSDYESYFVYSVLSNATIVGYKDGKFEEIDIPSGATVYRNQNPTTYAQIKEMLEMGDTLYIKRTQNGSVDYVTYDSNNLNGPIKVTDSTWSTQLGSANSSKVFRNGSESSTDAVQINDIVYYSEPLDVVFAYTDKVTGVYEKASPTKDSPEIVTVSGKDYRVESVDAFNDLSSSGSFKYGDTVTLLLGRTGEVAGVAGTGSASSVSSGAVSSGTAAGYVIDAGKKDFTNADNTVHSSYYVKVVSADGTETEYQTKSDYSSLVCSVVRVTFKNGLATLSKSSSGDKISGIVSSSRGIIGNNLLADNVSILDTIGSYNSDAPAYCRVYPQRLDGININSGDVLYYSKNSAGEIDQLILKDVTGDPYTYGVVLNLDTSTRSYTVDINGTQGTYLTGLSTRATGPHRLTMKNGAIETMRQLTSYSSKISSLTHTSAEIGDKTYLLSDSVVVYRRTDDYKYLKISLDEAINGDYRMTAYYDKAQSSGGRIRIIIAQNK